MSAAEKDAAARVRECLDEKRTHLRVGDWRGSQGCTVELIGTVADLHGSVCTCCPRRATKAAS